jgi:peptidoglycan-associated lipoprotein
MTRQHRAIALSVIAASAIFAACKKKPETAPAPVPVSNPAPTETCDAACRQRRADSIRVADSLANARSRDAAARSERERAAAAAKEALLAKIYFEYDMAELSDQTRATLDAKIRALRANPGVRLRISGHADERGSDEYNIALGQRRAAAAKRYLTDQGVDPSRLETVSYGEARPAVDGHDENAYRQNRRDEFEITAGADNIVGMEK